MHSVLTHITAGLLLVHALLGCCWHHAHGCSRCRPAAASASPACSHAGCKHHNERDQARHSDRPNHDDKVPKAPCKCPTECQGVCTFLPPQKVQVARSHAPLPFDFIAAATVAPDSQLQAGTRQTLCGLLKPEPPLRLHLLQQILLI